MITSNRKWFRSNELPLISPCTSPLLFRNAKPLSTSPTKTKHDPAAITGHAPTGNAFLCRSICRSSVPPEKEFSFNYTNDDDDGDNDNDNSHGKGPCANWNWTFWGVGCNVLYLVSIASPVYNVLSCSPRVVIMQLVSCNEYIIVFLTRSFCRYKASFRCNTTYSFSPLSRFTYVKLLWSCLP